MVKTWHVDFLLGHAAHSLMGPTGNSLETYAGSLPGQDVEDCH